MPKFIAFAVISAGLVFISRASLRAPRSHGFYRFFAWEIIVALFLINVDGWFKNPFSWHQLISWFLLIACIFPLILGVSFLAGKGKTGKHRRGEPQLLAFERTTQLVTTGIYHYIRHPLYSSLLFLAWGIFFKDPTWFGALLGMAATFFLLATAKADEAECVRFFGPEYETYMKKTRMFVPFLF